MSIKPMNRNLNRMDDLPELKPSRLYLAEMIFNGVPLKRIAEITGRNIPYLRRRLKEYNLLTPQQFKQTTLRELWKGRIAVLYMRLNGIKSIASSTPFSELTVPDILRDMGILTDLHLGSHVMKMRLESGWQPLSPHLQQVLEGELLGDGSLTMTSNPNPNPVRNPPSDDIFINALDDLQWFSWVNVKVDNLENAVPLFNKTRTILSHLNGAHFQLTMVPYASQWIEYVATQFREDGYYVNIYPSEWIDKDGVRHPMISLQTESSLNLSKELLKWYDLVKGVPWNFNLTPTSLLHWMMGDGSFGNEILFMTQSFHLTEVMRLALQLRRKVGIKTTLVWRPNKHKFGSSELLEPEQLAQLDPNRYWLIKAPTDPSSRTKFLDYLDQAPGIETARRVFPWKFSKDIRKQDCV
ncbi:MAG: hypothetical protein ACFFBD_07310 [Candidatus Hodarchaeota archaeon]